MVGVGVTEGASVVVGVIGLLNPAGNEHPLRSKQNKDERVINLRNIDNPFLLDISGIFN